MTDTPPAKRPGKWTLLIIIAVLFAVIVPIGYQYGKQIARDGINNALEEKARVDAENRETASPDKGE